MNTVRVSKGLDPEQDRHFVSPDQGPNCLQRLSTYQQMPKVAASNRECSGSVVECLTQDRGVAGSSLTCSTALVLQLATLIPFCTGSTQEDPSRHN